MQKLTITVVHKMFSIAEVEIKFIDCNSENKSCLLQVVHTKAIAALTQFAIFTRVIYIIGNQLDNIASNLQ